MSLMNNHILPPISSSLIQEQIYGLLPPAILFSGELYTGKRKTALALASSYLGTSSALKSPYFATIGTLPRLEEWVALTELYERDQLEIQHIKDFLSFLLRKFQPLFWKENKIKNMDLCLLKEFIHSSEIINSQEWEKVNTIVLKIIKLYPKRISVEQIRMIKEWAFSLRGEKKFILIEGVHTLSINGMNALLKILEEPPTDFMCILTTPNKYFLPETLLSRLRSYIFSPYSINQVKEILEKFEENSNFSCLKDFFSSFNKNVSFKIKNLARDFYFSLQESNPFPSELAWEDLFKEKRFDEKILRLFLENLLSIFQKRLHEKPEETCLLSTLMTIANQEIEKVFILHQNPLDFLQRLYYHLKQAWIFQEKFS